MTDFSSYKTSLEQNGFVIIPAVFSATEISALGSIIDAADHSKPGFRKSSELFAIRRFLQEIPESADTLFNPALKALIYQLFGPVYFMVKSIYFDKPEASNWFVSWHQDLTISVDRKTALPGFGPWTVKQDQFAVQPPIAVLENIYTVRIHLDDTDESNGALKVIPGSHLQGIRRPETVDPEIDKDVICNVPAGGIMIMKPLLLHSSGRSTGSRNRRVVHIEFSDITLPEALQWSEKMMIL